MYLDRLNLQRRYGGLPNHKTFHYLDFHKGGFDYNGLNARDWCAYIRIYHPIESRLL